MQIQKHTQTQQPIIGRPKTKKKNSPSTVAAAASLKQVFLAPYELGVVEQNEP